MQLHSNDGSTVEFWPAMGTNQYGSNCNSTHCIHNDSWEEIKAHPENYSQCITAGCTKTVTIDETSDPTYFTGTYGSEAGMLTGELTSDARKWSTTGSNQDPTYPNTLTAIKNASDIPAAATIKLLEKEELEAAKPNEADRIIYKSNGRADRWWLATPCEYGNDIAYLVYGDGGIYLNSVFDVGIGIAHGFSY